MPVPAPAAPARRRFTPPGPALLAVLIALLPAACGGGAGERQAAAETESLAGLQRQLAAQAEAAHDPAAAAVHYRRLAEAHPADAAAAAGLARSLRHAAQPEAALEAAETALARLGAVRPLRLEQAKALIALGALDRAAALLAELAAADPGDWEAPSLQGIILDRQGNHGAAQVAYRRALTLAPDNLQTRNNLALSLAQSGQLPEAEDILEGLVLHPQAPLNASQNLAMLYALGGRLDKAEALVRANLPPEAVDPMLKSLRRLAPADPAHQPPPAAQPPAGHPPAAQPPAAQPPAGTPSWTWDGSRAQPATTPHR